MNRILEQVQNGDFDPVKMFTGNKDKFSEVKTAIESISNNLPKEVCIQFILTKIIPTVFDKNVDNRVRDEAVEVGLHFLQFVNVSNLSTKDQEDVFNAIEERYTKTTGELRDSNYSNWDKLWIFLVKLCSDALHTKLSLANKLLRIVEVAFRNSTSIEQRVKAYDCWIELINNSSMKMEHMSSPKQIKLLVTPLKAKFSRTPVVIMKRCDTYVYLLGKLQDKATLCLKDFLEFCFGPFDEKNNTEKMKQGRGVPDVCNKSTKVLLEILDHSHGDLEKCLKSDDLQLYKPLINDTNFPNFADILINSVMECCILLNEWSQNSSINNIIIKCLWRSLLCLVQRSSEDVKKKCCTRIYNCLQKLLEGAREHEYLHHLILANILDLLIQEEISQNLKEILFDVGFNLLCSSATEALNVEKTADFIISCFDTENISKFDKTASKYFRNNTKCENSALCDIWLKCNVFDIANLIWPVRHYQHFKDVEALNAKWTKLYSSEYKTEGMKFTVMQEMEKLFLDNPLLSNNIIHFLELMSLAETIPSKDFVAKFMRLIELVLTLPNLSDTNIKQLSSIVMKYCDQSQNFYKTDNNDEALDKVCGCLEHLVTIHKDYTVLTELYTNLKNTQPKNLVKFSKRLLSCLESLMLNEDMSIVNKTRKIIELLETKENEPETITLATSRSLRIVNMANVTPKSKIASDQMNNLKLFGKDVNKTTPLILKGRKTYGKGRFSDHKNKKDPVASINDDKSSDYVKIDTEVKINLDNLSEHQKEMLKKRREDIPALYQDLTQSQSQDFFKSVDQVQASEKKIDELPTDQSKKEENNEEPNNIEDKQTSKNENNDDDCEEKISDSLVDQSRKEDINTDVPNGDDESERTDYLPVEESKKEVNEKKSPPSKKRKRDENHADEQISKVPKLFEETTSNNRLEELGVTKINDETKTQILEVATEESDQRSLDEEVARINVMEIDESFDVNINSSDGTEKINGETENDETQILEENHPSDENKTVEKSEEELDETKISPRSRLRRAEKKKTDDNSDRTLRKSKRNSGAQQLRDELVKVVQKQLETFTDEQNESTNEKLSETNEESVLENNLENDQEAGDEDKEPETSLRKSKRQVKKRQIDYVLNLSRKKKSDNVKTNDLHSSEEFEDTKKSVVKKRRRSGDLNSSRRSKSKQKDEQNQSRNKAADDDGDADESMEDLLARVDRRIEENRRREREKQAKEELQDGNQNEIISATQSSEEMKSAEVENLKEREDGEVNPERDFVKGKRRIKPSLKPLTIDSTTDVKLPSTKRGDVYEFKADDESSQSDGVKRSRKRRKTMFFDRSDYISKRRKKPKKETKDEGFPFHVTADSPLPLSKSQSLRAVPSQESETITIVITRSPVEKENKSSLEINDSSPTTTTNDVISTSPKKKNKRKNSTEVPNSDDIIESSQVTPIDTSKRRSSSSRNKSRALKQTTIEEMIKPQIYTSGRRRTRSCGPTEEDSLSLAATLTLESSKELIPANLPITKPRRLSLSEPSTQELKLGRRDKRSKSLDKLDPSAEPISFVLKPKVSEIEENVTLICETAVTNSEQDTLITDTEMIEQADTLTLSPVKSQSPDLPGSPVITKEDLPGSPVTCDTPDRTIELLNNTLDISPISSVQEMATPKPVASEVSNVRVARLLKMVNSNLTVGNEKSTWFGSKHSSPSSSKVRKMRLKKEENLDLLTFSREVPSPLTVPASGILKRKFNNLEEPTAPPPKRKRVNFSDPAISEKKIFIKDSEEYSDPDQTPESTSEYQLRSYELREFKKKVANKKKSEGLSGAPDREDMLLSFKDFCDSNFKDVAVDCSDLKSTLKTLIRNLKVPEVVEIVSEFLVDSNSETVDDVKSGTSQEVTDKYDQTEEFLSKLIDVVEKLPDEKLEHFINEIARVFGDNRTNKELTRKEIKDHIVKLDCDAMNDLIKEYFLTLQDQKRNDFLVSLMSLASSELPAKKEFVNCHFNILQNFVNKMTD